MSIATAASRSSSVLSHSATNIEPEQILEAAREQARTEGLNYAGDITPQQAWILLSQDDAKLIDVRTIEERQTVGYVPNSAHVAWAVGSSMQRNPNFVREFERHAGRLDVALLLCRSGKRSVAAAETLSRLGFKNVFNVLEGFEGEQGRHNGWLSLELPSTKD